MEQMAADPAGGSAPVPYDDDIEMGRFVVGDEDGPFGILASVQDFAGAFKQFQDPALHGQTRVALRSKLAGLLCEYLTGRKTMVGDLEAILRGDSSRLDTVAQAAGLATPVQPTPDLEWIFAEMARIPLVLLQMISIVQTRRDDAWRAAMEREQTALDREDENDDLDEIEADPDPEPEL